MKPDGERFAPKFISTWNKWCVEDRKFNRDSLVRDWRKNKGAASKNRPIWKGTEEAARNLAKLLNQAYWDDDKLITNVERSHSTYVPWQNGRGKTRQYHSTIGQTASGKAAIAAQFKKCACGAMYKGDRHCDRSV